MARNSNGVSYDIVIRELIQEQNELQEMMVDILSAVSQTHPELTIKYMNFVARINSEKKQRKK